TCAFAGRMRRFVTSRSHRPPEDPGTQLALAPSMPRVRNQSPSTRERDYPPAIPGCGQLLRSCRARKRQALELAKGKDFLAKFFSTLNDCHKIIWHLLPDRAFVLY
ncbi:hypothetical protein, partial [Limoniibacter endophyticus]|uniref:hypothetical protein n=1 Tax=Limoniibacter endophyticus TaxID=1565040 RepID=UPI003617ED60